MGQPLPDHQDTNGQQPRWVIAHGDSTSTIGPSDTIDQARAKAVELYREWASDQLDLTRRVRLELAGQNLACWCPDQSPCQADVLLQLANPGTRR